jgi:hypothetical protein
MSSVSHKQNRGGKWSNSTYEGRYIRQKTQVLFRSTHFDSNNLVRKREKSK